MFNTVVSASLRSCIEVIHSIVSDEVCCVSHHARLHAIAVRHSILAVFALRTRLRPLRAHRRSVSAQDRPRALHEIAPQHCLREKRDSQPKFLSFFSAKTLSAPRARDNAHFSGFILFFFRALSVSPVFVESLHGQFYPGQLIGNYRSSIFVYCCSVICLGGTRRSRPLFSGVTQLGPTKWRD